MPISPTGANWSTAAGIASPAERLEVIIAECRKRGLTTNEIVSRLESLKSAGSNEIPPKEIDAAIAQLKKEAPLAPVIRMITQLKQTILKRAMVEAQRQLLSQQKTSPTAAPGVSQTAPSKST